jgi:hypothetical protein
MSIRTGTLGFAALAMLAAGCGGYQGRGHVSETLSSDKQKVPVEAYLFDARLRRQGKPTSFRLEVFRTDSVAGFGGRAYLGRGALKGRLTDDSLEVYFPSSNEYVYESVDNLFRSADCPHLATGLNLLDAFTSLPDSLDHVGSLEVVSDYSDEDRPEFVLKATNCPWKMELIYDRREGGWHIREFRFDNGGEVTLKASRRTYKDARAPLSKFAVPVPFGAIRIIP